MFRNLSRQIAVLLFAAFGLLTPRCVHATAIANSAISFSNLQIAPSTGTILFLDDWSAEAFAQAQNSLGELNNQFDSSIGGAAAANATVTFATSADNASATNLTGSASSSVNIPATITAQASSVGRGTLFNLFVITGGSGDVDVNFSVDLTGSLDLLTDAFGQLAQTETIFDLELDGNPILFRDDILSIGPNAFASMPFSQKLSDTRTLQFDTFYFILAQADSESQAINIPEPSTVTLMLAGLITLTRYIRRKT